jgi:hypothetical protein
MELHEEHALIQLLNAFLDALGEKFVRKRNDQKWTPRATALALLILVLEGTSKGYGPLLSTLRSLRQDLQLGDSPESSFCRARRKLSPTLLELGWKAMRACMCDMFDDIHPNVRGYRLVAIDGVWMNGRRSHKLFRALRKPKRGRPPKNFKGQPQMLLVCLADVLTRTPIAWEYVERGRGERSAAMRLLAHLDDRMILTADRGFPARTLLDGLLGTGCRFIMRMPAGRSAFAEVRDFMGGSARDQRVRVTVGRGRGTTLATARLVRGRPPSARGAKSPEEWVLLSNLPRNRWSVSILMSLYHERWGIETLFRELKDIVGLNHFHAHDIDGMKAEITMAMLAASLMSAAELIALTVKTGRMPDWDDVHQRRCNRATLATIVLNAIKLNPEVNDVAEILDNELRIAALRARPRRPGRWAPRICKSFYGKWKHRFDRARA